MRGLLTSMRRKGGERTKAKFVGRTVRIWSGEWSAWWRPESRGYTDDITQAGIYSFEDAWATSAHCGPEKKIAYEIVEAHV
ncbi:MAG TPA: hypothetical protein VGN79_12245 [Devosia sp.]|jgi:hypothetical protein|nr:hypothetical protein [Devosia sp.]